MTKYTEENLKKKRAGQATRVEPNCLSDMLLELMNERLVEARDMSRATGIPECTLHGWVNYITKCHRMDGSILALAKLFNVSIHYLVFGMGDESPVFGEENPSLEVKKKKLLEANKKQSWRFH